MLLTLSNKAFGGVGCEPGLAVCELIRLWNKLKLTWDLPVIQEAQRLCLVLHELHVLEVELRKKNRKKEGGGKQIYEQRLKKKKVFSFRSCEAIVSFGCLHNALFHYFFIIMYFNLMPGRIVR